MSNPVQEIVGVAPTLTTGLAAIGVSALGVGAMVWIWRRALANWKDMSR